MNKIDLTKQFASRLRDAMMASGYYSLRSTSGVDIHKLSEITGYSLQICRKYLRGQAIPEPTILVEIAMKLNVSPGWLLFGDIQVQNSLANNRVCIPKSLLHYLFTRASELYLAHQSADGVADFLFNLSLDISQIDTTEEQLKQIIDLAFSSAKYFNPPVPID